MQMNIKTKILWKVLQNKDDFFSSEKAIYTCMHAKSHVYPAVG